WLNVHLKGGGKLGTKVAKVLIKENKQHQAFLACGTEAAKGAHAVSPEILICNMERQTEIEDYVTQTIDMDSEFIQLYKVEVSPEIENYARRLKDNNVRVNYCCTDSPEEVIKLFDYGVDFILVNEVGKIMKAMESKQINLE
ncbi:MAG: glycerophosphodiester phosphodiesterase, partial [Cyclobacteriaceae bacterium]|nr:glycerophosphodiester phosphodiesterase [Cyclobacteriaceae bacterium]